MTSVFHVHEVQQPGRGIEMIARPTSVRDAVAALAENPRARPLAGGTDLLLDLQRGGPGDAVTLVDLTTIEGFRSIEETADAWLLAGGVRHNQVVQHSALRESALPLAQACLEVGSPQLRNRATIAGNLATASPANDTISALMALGASVELARLGDDGSVETRIVLVEEFFTGFRQTVLSPSELITSIRVPKLAANERGIWVKLGLRRAQAISVVHAGMVVGFDSDGATISTARLAMGSVAATVVLVDGFRDAMVGNKIDDDSINSAADAANHELTPISDVRATADYRVDGIDTLVRRSLAALATGKEASMWPHEPPTLSTADQLEAVAATTENTVASDDSIELILNGSPVSGANPTATLLDWVRDTAGATGMKEGCAEGECGACTMLLDGAAVMGCLVTAAQASGRHVDTVEGLDHPIQKAFVDDFAVQCGFCIPGFLMSGARLLDETDDPTIEQIQLGLSGNLCRCTGYYPITQAITDAAVEVRGAR